MAGTKNKVNSVATECLHAGWHGRPETRSQSKRRVLPRIVLGRLPQPPVGKDDDLRGLALGVERWLMLDPSAKLLDLAGRDLVEIDPDLHQRHGKQPCCEIEA